MISEQLLQRFRVEHHEKFRLRDHDPGWAQSDELKEFGKAAVKERAEEILAKNLEELAQAQDKLYADNRYAILAIFQAMDAAGKDGTIKHVMSGVNPQGCQVFSFKKPSDEELDHTFLWRCMIRLPERGRIGIFNRSYYEEVLAVKVHPELLQYQRLPISHVGESFWKDRYDDINQFERHLARNGTIVLKFFLNVSKDEQRRRFLERLENPDKYWKFSAADVTERKFWDAYMQAYEEAIQATSTPWAPWYVVPADQKWVTRAVVADVLTSTIRHLDLRYPEPTEDRRDALKAAHKALKNE